MNWTCPHCQRKLASSQTPPSGNAPEGWFYSLCGECQGRSIVRADTGDALRIRKIGPRIETLPVASPVAVPPAPRWAHATPLPRASRQARLVSLSIPVIFFGIGVGGYLLDQRRESLERATVTRDLAAQVIAQELLDPATVATRPAAPQTSMSSRLQSDRLRLTSASTAPPSTFEVQARDRTASLHSGPGSEYSILGVANPDERYAVLEMTSHWFKVPLGEAGQLVWIQRADVDVRVQSDAPADAPANAEEAERD